MSSLKARLKLTNYCTNNCWYCSDDERNNKEMSYETLYNILSFLQKIVDTGEFKRTKITATGGNPFLTNRIIDYITLLNTEFNLNHLASADVCFPTNIERIKTYINMGGWFMLSMNEAPLSEMENIIKEVGTSSLFVYNVLLTKFNIGRMNDILLFVDKYKLPMRLDHIFDPFDSKNSIPLILDTFDIIFPSLIKSKIKYTYNHVLGNMYPYKKRAVDYCGYGNSAYYFDTYGNVRRCQMEETIGHIFDENLIDKLKTPITIHDECSTCLAFNYCKGGCRHINKDKLYCSIYKKVGYYIDIMKREGLCN